MNCSIGHVLFDPNRRVSIFMNQIVWERLVLLLLSYLGPIYVDTCIN